MVPYAHRAQALDEGIAVGPVPITHQIPRHIIPGKGFGNLPGDPFGGRLIGVKTPKAAIQRHAEAMRSGMVFHDRVDPSSSPDGTLPAESR
jgi:hypothetical protein